MLCDEASKVRVSDAGLQRAAAPAAVPPSEPATRPHGAERRVKSIRVRRRRSFFRLVMVLVSSSQPTDSWMTKMSQTALRKQTKRKMFHATMLVTRTEEWCVEAETAEEARQLL